MDNLQDARKKGRLRVPRPYGKGKLTAEDAFYIRTSGASARALALLFGVHRDTIFDVKRGNNWTRAIDDLFAPLAAD